MCNLRDRVRAWYRREADARDCIAIFAIVASACALSCALIPKQTFNPADCPKVDLAELEAEYIAESVRECKAEGATSRATCKAWPAIRDKYRARRAAYVECQPKE